MYSRRHRRQPGLPLILLATQLLQVGFNNIPPVTLVSILSQVAIFLGLIPLGKGWSSIKDICMSSHSIIHQHDFKRLITAPFFHLDDWHLYYNMVSFLWKGQHLERRMGSPYFTYLLAVFSVLTSMVTAVLGLVATELTGNHFYTHQCAAGFSGVIFALKVLTTHDSPQAELVMGFLPVPGPLICWAELFIIQLIAPNASFIGHLAGIIVGLLYVKGPLKYIMNCLVPRELSYNNSFSGRSDNSDYRRQSSRRNRRSNFPWPFNSGNDEHYPHERPPSHFNHRGTTGTGAQRNNPPPPGFRQDVTFAYTAGLSEEEQLRRALEESRQSNVYKGRPEASAPTLPPGTMPPSYEEATGRGNRLDPDLSANGDQAAEMRRRRLARFS